MMLRTASIRCRRAFRRIAGRQGKKFSENQSSLGWLSQLDVYTPVDQRYFSTSSTTYVSGHFDAQREGIQLLYGDWRGQFVIVHKPAGIPVQSQGRDSLEERIKRIVGHDQVWLVHRLDKYTSGILVVALSKDMASRLQMSLSRVSSVSTRRLSELPKDMLSRKEAGSGTTKAPPGNSEINAQNGMWNPSRTRRRVADRHALELEPWTKKYRVLVDLPSCVRKTVIRDWLNENPSDNNTLNHQAKGRREGEIEGGEREGNSEGVKEAGTSHQVLGSSLSNAVRPPTDEERERYQAWVDFEPEHTPLLLQNSSVRRIVGRNRRLCEKGEKSRRKEEETTDNTIVERDINKIDSNSNSNGNGNCNSSIGDTMSQHCMIDSNMRLIKEGLIASHHIRRHMLPPQWTNLHPWAPLSVLREEANRRLSKGTNTHTSKDEDVNQWLQQQQQQRQQQQQKQGNDPSSGEISKGDSSIETQALRMLPDIHLAEALGKQTYVRVLNGALAPPVPVVYDFIDSPSSSTAATTTTTTTTSSSSPTSPSSSSTTTSTPSSSIPLNSKLPATSKEVIQKAPWTWINDALLRSEEMVNNCHHHTLSHPDLIGLINHRLLFTPQSYTHLPRCLPCGCPLPHDVLRRSVPSLPLHPSISHRQPRVGILGNLSTHSLSTLNEHNRQNASSICTNDTMDQTPAGVINTSSSDIESIRQVDECEEYANNVTQELLTLLPKHWQHIAEDWHDRPHPFVPEVTLCESVPSTHTRTGFKIKSATSHSNNANNNTSYNASTTLNNNNSSTTNNTNSSGNSHSNSNTTNIKNTAQNGDSSINMDDANKANISGNYTSTIRYPSINNPSILSATENSRPWGEAPKGSVKLKIGMANKDKKEKDGQQQQQGEDQSQGKEGVKDNETEGEGNVEHGSGRGKGRGKEDKENSADDDVVVPAVLVPKGSYTLCEQIDTAKTSLTQFKLEGTYPRSGTAMYTATLYTGRTHQIRLHFSDSGLPIVGDMYYNAKAVSKWVRAYLDRDGAIDDDPVARSIYKQHDTNTLAQENRGEDKEVIKGNDQYDNAMGEKISHDSSDRSINKMLHHRTKGYNTALIADPLDGEVGTILSGTTGEEEEAIMCLQAYMLQLPLPDLDMVSRAQDLVKQKVEETEMRRIAYGGRKKEKEKEREKVTLRREIEALAEELRSLGIPELTEALNADPFYVIDEETLKKKKIDEEKMKNHAVYKTVMREERQRLTKAFEKYKQAVLQGAKEWTDIYEEDDNYLDTLIASPDHVRDHSLSLPQISQSRREVEDDNSHKATLSHSNNEGRNGGARTILSCGTYANPYNVTHVTRLPSLYLTEQSLITHQQGTVKSEEGERQDGEVARMSGDKEKRNQAGGTETISYKMWTFVTPLGTKMLRIILDQPPSWSVYMQ